MSRMFNENEWSTGDTHFGHSRVLAYSKRPFSTIEEHDEVLIDNWNKTVHKKDKIYHHGDVSFYGREKTKEIVGRLKGYKILIKGNHDLSKSAKYWYDVGFDEVYGYEYIRNGIIFSHCISQCRCMPNIHAHLHDSKGSAYDYGRLNCVSVDCYDFKPVRTMDILRGWDLDSYGEKIK